MEQRGDRHWHGHREITAAAVARLFHDRDGPDRMIRGVRGLEYFRRLNKAQAHADRIVAAGEIEDIAGTTIDLPFVGLGPTAHDAYVNGAAQREHYMADPRRSGPENWELNNRFIYDQLALARSAGGLAAEMRHLGAAVHALQDSYSAAHAFRDLSVYDGDPEARVLSINVYTPYHVLGFDDGRNTHVDEFDRPPAGSGPARAAAEATYRLLAVYERTRGLDWEEMEPEIRRVLDPMLAPVMVGNENGDQEVGVEVNLDPEDERWQADRDNRLDRERGGPSAAERRLITGVLEQQQGKVGYRAEGGRPYQERQAGVQPSRPIERT